MKNYLPLPDLLKQCTVPLYKGILALLCLIALQAHGQQIPVYSSYFFNKYLVNPAFTGIDNEYRAFGFYRSQWSSIANRPTTGGATTEASVWKDRIGVGGFVVNDRIGIFNSVNAQLSYAQKIQVAKDHQLSVGVQAGIFTNRINFAQATVADLNDPHIAQMNPIKMVFDLNAGIGYKWKELLVGFGITNITQPLASYASPGLASNFQYVRHYTGFAQYKFKLLNGKFNITPQLFLRKGPATGYQFDATLMLDYNNLIFLGGGYRNPFGVVGIVGVNVFNMFMISYAYDYTANPALAGYVGSTHEITAGFHIPSNYKRKKAYEPGAVIERDSFNRMQRHLAEQKEAADSAADVAAKQLKKLQQQNDSLKDENSRYRKLLDSLSKKVDDLFKSKAFDGTKEPGEGNYILDKIFFDYKNAELNAASYKQLDEFAAFMKRFPKVKIMVTGYTDDIGSDAFNRQLSLGRAKAVANYLQTIGIDAGRIKSQGLGKANPMVPNDSDEARKINRRVEFSIIK